jgi:hypothetical protein
VTRWIAGALVLVAGTIALYSMRPGPEASAVDFTDDLKGPAAPRLDIPFDAYALTPDGLLRAKSVTGRDFGNDRPMVRSVSGAYASRDFVFEVDVRIPAEIQDLAYVGFGRGDPNPAYYNEPASAYLFRIHNGVGANAINAAASRPATARQTEAGPVVYAAFQTIATYVSGSTTTFRIERHGNRVTLSLPAAPDASHTFDMSLLPGLFGEGEGFLFLGNSTEGTVFSNLRVRPRG